MNKRELTLQKAAYDYHFSSLTIQEIAKKYKIAYSTVSSAKNKYLIEWFKDDIPKHNYIKDCVVLINEVELERAIFLFKEYNIKYSLPINADIQIQFESKL